MLSKSNLKYIKSLQIKKIRKEERLFVVEGAKSVVELLNSDFKINQLLCTSQFYELNTSAIALFDGEPIICSEKELTDLGGFATNNAALAVAEMKENILLTPDAGDYLLLLDEIKDPGNLGTILRIADWYGIAKVIASEGTAEFYNPKVIASTMGSFTRTQIYYCDLQAYLSTYKTHVYGARLEGENIHRTVFSAQGGMILMGNESHGIAPELYPLVDEFVHIPAYGQAESLNVAVATAIFCDNMRRSVAIKG